MGWAKVRVQPDRFAVRRSRKVELILLAEDVAEPEMGLHMVGIEPEDFTVLGFRRRVVVLDVAENTAKIDVGRDVVGPGRERFAEPGDGLLHRRYGLGPIPLGLAQRRQAAPVPAIAGLEVRQVVEHREGLVDPAPPIQRMGQVVRRLRPQGPGCRVVPDRLVRPRRLDLLESVPQRMVDPDIVGVVRPGAVEQFGGGGGLLGVEQRRGQQRDGLDRPAPGVGILRKGEQGLALLRGHGL